MSEHKVKLEWSRNGLDFGYKNYSRNHNWNFDDKQVISASAASQFLGDPDMVDPEQAFVASLSSCHLLTFLAIASFKKLVIDSYVDDAIGYLGKNDDGKFVITRVELNPRITFATGAEPNREELEAMHHKAHADCFLANSVRCEIVTNIP